MERAIIHSIKALLPKGRQYRKLLLGPAAGCVMALDFHSHLKAYLGIYEYELLPHLKRMLRSGVNCFDVGGRDGYDALMMANRSRGKVISFECDHEAAEEMRRTFALNRKLAIQVVESYVGAINGPGYITIDKASREWFKPDFIKLDIEGAEDTALEGASETLASHRPNLIIEVHGADKEEHCISILSKYGYNVIIINQGKFLKDPARGGYNRWLAAYPPVGSA
jgi:hypothetical protein